MTHLTQDDLTLLYYGEMSEAEIRSARAHLEGCAACRLEQEQLRRLFGMVSGLTVPDPAEGFETEVWKRLQPGLRASSSPRRTSLVDRLREWLVPTRGWALGGAMMAVVLVAFALGRYWQPERHRATPAEQTAAERPDNLRERILLSALSDHFDRTQTMLVELASTTPERTVDISGEQRRAHDLLAATRIYRRAAAEAGDRTVGDVLEALERVLVEVEVSPSQLSTYELRSLQSRIEEQELLFKVRVASATVRAREQSSRPPAGV
jgi:hypothetical protein